MLLFRKVLLEKKLVGIFGLFVFPPVLMINTSCYVTGPMEPVQSFIIVIPSTQGKVWVKSPEIGTFFKKVEKKKKMLEGTGRDRDHGKGVTGITA